MDVRLTGWMPILFSLLIASFSQAAEAAPRSLRVATYNVWGLPRPLLAKPARLPLIQHRITDLQADVITFQETFDKKTAILAHVPGFPHHAYGPAATRGKLSSGLLIVSRWPITQVNRLRYSKCSGNDCLSNKGALHVRVRVPGLGEVDLFTTHLNAGGNVSVRNHQASQLRDFVNRHSGSGSRSRPVIVTGDFNFKMDSPTYHGMIRDGSYRDSHAVYRSTRPGLPAHAWHGYTMDPVRNANMRYARLFYKPARIDYVWFRSSTCVRTEVDASSLFFDAPVNGKYLSDHFGVVTDLSIENRCSGS